MPSRLRSGLHRASAGIVPALFLAASCATSGSLSDGRVTPSLPGPTLLGTPIEIQLAPVFQEIRVLEGTRNLGDGRLVELLQKAEDESIRARAATALGRMPFPEFGPGVTSPLCEALRDTSAVVRAAAAFALATRADPQSAGVVLSYWRDSDATVRERLVDAAARMATPPIRVQILRRLQDPDLSVRQAALRATTLWSREDPDADDVDSALLNALSPYPDATGRRVDPDPKIVWLALFSLARRKAEKGRGAFLEHVGSEDVRARIFSAHGLSQIPARADGTRALEAALQDPDWRVVCEAAIGLGRSRDESVVRPLLGCIGHASPHVRACVVESLSNFPTRSTEILPHAWRASQDLSGQVRGAALMTLARLADGAEAARILAEAAKDRDRVVRAGVAKAASEPTFEGFRAIPLLEQLAHDPEPFVATRALEGLKNHPTPRTRSILLDFLGHPDNGLRLAAVQALGERDNARPADVPALVRALETSKGDIASEIAFNVLRLLGTLGGEEASEAVVASLDHPDLYVRRIAREVLEQSFGRPPDRTDAPPPALAPERTVPLPGRDYPVWKRNPIAEIATSRGTMTFELFAAEAPLHVHNFVELAHRDHYDGLIFHRVVPDYVIQGGDYRGDGNGAASWQGGALPHEFTPRAYVRGSLGMPRNDDYDSGGSQFFVTHRETPHLDGRYTQFGILRSGIEVLDAIEVGDVILDVRVTD